MATMDWLPTLLAAAGAQPDSALPPDGENLLPILTGQAQPHPRKLFFRYRPANQRAVREGDWKYLRIAGNEFLFDVVTDPRERADQKVRQAAIFNRLKADWEAWEKTMLPPKPGIQPYRHPGSVMAACFCLAFLPSIAAISILLSAASTFAAVAFPVTCVAWFAATLAVRHRNRIKPPDHDL